MITKIKLQDITPKQIEEVKSYCDIIHCCKGCPLTLFSPTRCKKMLEDANERANNTTPVYFFFQKEEK